MSVRLGTLAQNGRVGVRWIFLLVRCPLRNGTYPKGCTVVVGATGTGRPTAPETGRETRGGDGGRRVGRGTSGCSLRGRQWPLPFPSSSPVPSPLSSLWNRIVWRVCQRWSCRFNSDRGIRTGGRMMKEETMNILTRLRNLASFPDIALSAITCSCLLASSWLPSGPHMAYP